MLNGYHRQFLRHLDIYRVRFIVIGGQARWFHSWEPTQDLDLWVDISGPNKDQIESALIAWGARYPLHTRQSFQRSSKLRPKVQIHFPEDDALFSNENSEVEQIRAHDGIDLLTSLLELSFDECWTRADERNEGGIAFRTLCKKDLAATHDRSS